VELAIINLSRKRKQQYVMDVKNLNLYIQKDYAISVMQDLKDMEILHVSERKREIHCVHIAMNIQCMPKDFVRLVTIDTEQQVHQNLKEEFILARLRDVMRKLFLGVVVKHIKI